MAAPFTSLPLIGVDLNSITRAADVGTTAEVAPQLGVETFGSNGKLYVYAQANASITASTAVCTVNATTFLATASGGAYASPATDMVSGDRGWFSKASV